MPVQIINTLSNHRKKTAALLFGVFYMQVALPNILANRQAALTESFSAHNYYAARDYATANKEIATVKERPYEKRTASVNNKPQRKETYKSGYRRTRTA